MSDKSPPHGEDVRKVVEARIAALEAGRGLQHTVTVEWRGTQVPVPVISMPLELLSYNPGTHRIRAQRTLDPARDRELEEDPFGPAAQRYLHDLLMGDPSDPQRTDPHFVALKEDLKEHTQNEPGIITRSGVLINGNTRRAALKELGEPNIRVGVLPPDAATDDLDAVELSLQLRKEHKRDYSFMNLLLAIDERVRAGWSPEKIAREFRIKPKTVERNLWILGTVLEVIERSRVKGADGTETSLRLVDFEQDQGKLEELYRAYSTQKAKAPDDAEALLQQRLLAIILDKSKTDVRLIEADFAERYMPSLVEAAPMAAAPREVVIPGTNISVPAASDRVRGLKELTTSVLRARATTLSPGPATAEQVTQAEAKLGAVKEAMEKALDQAGRSGRVTKRRLAPSDRLSDANEDFRLSHAAIAEARSTGDFDAEDLDDELKALRANLTKLAQLAGRDEEAAGDGLRWLRAVAALDIPSPA